MHPGADGKYSAYNADYNACGRELPIHKLADVNDHNSRVND